ncbi:hypothetical protein SLS60_010980 [Paraconiothyrium brasiliense]|uniref:AB hydrolase-1 domain-containing protein n=1 Tax=Paraconiothyrium brasiliense TaxID=300254 RepID=A0ABR3QMJ4_9PLEO
MTLQNKVIDLEVANGTPSPTVDPSVHTILVGHSMGGIVAAETLLSLIEDQPISSLQNSASHSASSFQDSSSLMFPYIQAILAFDTPYLGIAPGVVAHGAEKHWNTASSAYSAYSNLAGAFGWGKGTEPGAQTAVNSGRMLEGAQRSAQAVSDANADAASVPLWQKYGRVALFAGAAGAVAAGGAAAYMKREQISEGLGWATSHLEFIGALARPEEMKKRLASITKLGQTHNIGFVNIYTTLGHAVDSQEKSSWTGKVVGRDRTFCNLPKGDLRQYYVPAVNDKSTAETWAHMSMFDPKQNPGYYIMSEHAKEHVIDWATNEWYEDSDGAMKGVSIEEEEVLVDRPQEEEFEDVKRPDDNPWRDEL